MALVLGGFTGLGFVLILHSGGAWWAWTIFGIGVLLSLRWAFPRRL